MIGTIKKYVEFNYLRVFGQTRSESSVFIAAYNEMPKSGNFRYVSEATLKICRCVCIHTHIYEEMREFPEHGHCGACDILITATRVSRVLLRLPHEYVRDEQIIYVIATTYTYTICTYP